MNKKVASEIVVGVILLITIVVGGVFWMQNKKASFLQTVKTKPTAPVAQVQQPQVVQPTSQADEVLINRGKGLEKINIDTKIISSVEDPHFADLSEYAGLPKEFKNKKTILSNSVLIVSEDKSKTIVVSNTYDQTKKPSDFDGSLPNLKSEDFLCLTKEKTCSPSKILSDAENKIRENGDSILLWWHNWDSQKNLLYAHLSSDGIGNASPVYVYDTNNNTYKKTIGYDSNGEGKRAEVPQGEFSPSLKKFVMIDENTSLDANGNAKYGSWDLLLYNGDNLSKPSKKINVSQMQKDGTEYYRIGSVAWSQDENLLAVATSDGQIFTLDLTNGQIELKYTYPKKVDDSGWFEFNKIDLSQSGRYITFFVSEKAKKGEKADSNGNVGVLKTIDLKNNNAATEILRDGDVSLF